MPRAPRHRYWPLILALALVGCGARFRPFTARPITLRDGDLTRWGPPPAPRPGTALWDATDGLLFRPQIRALSLPSPTESVDVNALDEVPDSSFFANRIGARAMTPEEVARGACATIDEAPARPWRVVEAKPEGVQPGFVIVDAEGRRWLLKTDGRRQPERATAADAVVAALFHAVGYHVPCNRVVFFRADDLRVDADGPPASDAHAVVEAAFRTPDGRRRAMVSAFVGGTPLGPWSYTGVWEADRNDRVPHELRRELRALRYFMAWVDHVDSRGQNTLAYWVGDERAGYVRHALIDFGDSFGATAADPRQSNRYGHATWVDPTATVEDLLTLGLLPRPWYRDAPPPEATLGDFATEPFDPDRWRANFANGAFAEADETDAAWAARILARLGPEHLRAAAEVARFSDPETTERLVEALAARRRTILEAHLTRRSPLTRARLEGLRLCVEDAAVAGGLRAASGRVDRTRARWRDGGPVEVRTTREGAVLCARLPVPVSRYLVVDLSTETPGRDAPGPLRVHLMRDGDGYRLVGIERPARGGAPSP